MNQVRASELTKSNAGLRRRALDAIYGIRVCRRENFNPYARQEQARLIVLLRQYRKLHSQNTRLIGGK